MFTIAIGNTETERSDQCGGKALGCSKLKRLGYNTPEGYVITDNAFREFLKQTELQVEYQKILTSFLLASDQAVIEKFCTDFQNAVKKASLPETIQQAILLSHKKIDGLCAVRSSASVEDSSSYAFAGVFHSELNVKHDALSGIILDCWASFFDYRVLSEVLRNNIDPGLMGIALLVQEMIPADHAGVLFTMDPTGHDTETAILSLTHGTAEKLMDGETEGTHVRINRKTGTIVDPAGKTALSDKVFNELTTAGFKLEKKLKHPQDIEWAVVDDTLYFLQMRPVTTVEIEALRDIVWSRELSEERYPQPISNLGWSIINDLLPLNLSVLANRFGLVARRPDQVAKTIRNYVYGNKNFFTIPGSLRPNPFSQKRLLKELLKESLSIGKYALPAVFNRGSKFGFKWLAVSRYFKAFIFPHAGEILSTWDSHVSATIKDMDAFNQQTPSTMSLKELWNHRMQMDAVARQYMEADLAIYVVKMACSWMIERIGKELRGDDHVSFLVDLTSGLENNRTLEMNRDMEIMADYVRNQPEVKAFLEAEEFDKALELLNTVNKPLLSEFIDKNGHLTTNWDIKEPTWGEDPHKVMQMLRGQIMTDSHRSVSDFHKASRQRYLDLRDDVISRLNDSAWMSPFFEDVVTYLRQFMRIDEEHHFYCSRLFKPMRELFHEIGKRFVAQNIIENVDDIFFLTLEEIDDIINNESFFTRKFLIRTRRSSFNQSHTISPPDTIIGQRPVIEEPDCEALKNAWKGIGGSSGIAEGQVRIVETTEQARDFKEGEIFVTTSPNPAFTPLFSIASGLVSATGSILSHGLVSAREYQLPAVTGIADIAKKLKNGQKVKVDGNTGIVSILSE